MSLPLSIVIIVLISEFIQWFGYSQIASIACSIYLNTFQKEKLLRQRKTKKDILNIKHDLSRTSSQDQFAKWAKMRRKLDSKTAELEKMTSSLGYLKTTFEIKFTTFLWVAINAIQIIIVLWYRSSPVFYLPRDWFNPVTLIFSFPFAPSGSVSVPMWFLICRRMLKKIVTTCKDAFPLYNEYVPETIKKNLFILISWCGAKFRVYLPVAVEWIKIKKQTLSDLTRDKEKVLQSKNSSLSSPPPVIVTPKTSTNDCDGASGSGATENRTND